MREGHVGLPFPWACRSRAYLTACAWLRWFCGREADWRHRAASYAETMRFNNYPSKAQLGRFARAAGAEVWFAEAEEFMFREGSPHKTALLALLRKVKLERAAVRIFGLMMLQRYMILRAHHATAP